MNEKLRAKIDQLIKLTEEFGFEVGMHNKCFYDALQKRVVKFGENSEEFALHTLQLLETRIRYLKNKAKWWYLERPEHFENATKWHNLIENRNNLDELNSAQLGTILAIKRPGKFSGHDYALKTTNGWSEIVDIETKDEIFDATLTGKVWEVNSEILPKFNAISMVYEGFDGITPRHITDLKSLPWGIMIQVGDNSFYTKISDEMWRVSPGEDLLSNHYFDLALKEKSVIVL